MGGPEKTVDSRAQDDPWWGRAWLLLVEWGLLLAAVGAFTITEVYQPYVIWGLVALARAARPLMSEGGSMVALSYYGAEKVVPRYNVMGVAKAALEATVRYLAAELGEEGIRVNTISAGPVKTLSAGAFKGFRDMIHYVEDRAPLGRNITAEEVGKTALYLLSDLSSGVTGQTIYVDAGYSILGMVEPCEEVE